jgi:hypothetical protein
MINKNKYLLPWKYNKMNNHCERKSLFNEYMTYRINYNNFYYDLSYHFYYEREHIFPTLEEAKNHFDQILIKNEFIFVPENKIEQYKLLL